MAHLSKSTVKSYVGDVIPIRLIDDGIDKEGSVLWGASGDAVRLRSFGDGVLVSLVAEGEATVFAEYKGESYEASIFAVPMKSTELSDGFEYYFADMHCHTSTNHDPVGFADQDGESIRHYAECVAKDGELDLTVISDHASVTNDADFFLGFELAGDAKKPIIFAGAESEVTYEERDRFGVMHRKSGEIVTLMTAGYTEAATFADFEDCIKVSEYGIGIFAHPHVVGYSTNGIWDFDFGRRSTPFMLRLMKGVEMGNGEDRKENLLHEYAYSAALDAGFHVSTTCASDSHGPSWGFGIMPAKTVILAREATKEAFHEALLKNRFYATESGNVRLSYSVNGAIAPCEIKSAEEYCFHLELGSFRDDQSTIPVLCMVISDGGKALLELPINDTELDFCLHAPEASYFYLKLVDSEGRKTWSYPVWCGKGSASRENDSYEIEPIDPLGFSAYSKGADASPAISTNPYEPWCSEEKFPEITVDMGKCLEICAFGYYPKIILRDYDDPTFTTSKEACGLVSRYEVYASVDGIEYELLFRENVQALGDELITRFAPRVARYVKMKVIATVGTDSFIPKYSESNAAIGCLTLFKRKIKGNT